MSLRAALSDRFAVSDTGDGALLLRPHARRGRAMVLVISGEAEDRLEAMTSPESTATHVASAIDSARGGERYLLLQGDRLTPSLSSTTVVRDQASSETAPGEGTWKLLST